MLQRLARPDQDQGLPVVMVHAMAPLVDQPGGEVERQQFLERSYDLFSARYYREGEVPALQDADQAHMPLVLPWPKLRGHKVEITWQTASLYRLLVKRMANAGDNARCYLENPPARALLRPAGILGLLPENNEARFRALMEMMIGPYMGANPQKGITYHWIPNHLQDTAGQIAPRAFLKLFALAAEIRRDKVDQLPGAALLRPTDLQGALMETSNDRIRELQEEYPWIEDLKGSLKELEVPMTRAQFSSALSHTAWGAQAERMLLDKSPSSVFAYLKEIAVVELRTDGRVNVPEIYLYGFQLKRRGGIIRPS